MALNGAYQVHTQAASSSTKAQPPFQHRALNIMDRAEILRVLFHPVRIKKSEAPQHAVNLDVLVEEGIRIGCRLFTHSTTAATIIFFHGNGEIVPDYDEVGPAYLREQLNFVVCDYRGYGWSDGSPRTSTLLEDSNKVFVFLQAWLNQQGYSGPLVIMGRSLGSASAIEIALRHGKAINGLIIESGFAHTLPLAKVLGVDLQQMGIKEEQTFNNADKIGKITIPTLILHGQYDQLIPLWQAETLQAQSGAKHKEFLIVPGADHNSIIAMGGWRYFEAIRKFVEKATGAALDWRQRRKQFKAEQALKESAGE